MVERAGEAGIGEIEAAVLEAWSARRLVTFEDAERGLCFGRLDLDGVLRPLYVGRRWVHEEQTPIVVNWQAPAARPFYTATVAEPQGLTRRRRFRTEGPHAARPLRRAARRLRRRRRPRRRGHPARGARTQPRPAHARHRRDDPDRPVPPDHARARGRTRHPGRARHREDRGRPAPRVVAALQLPPGARARRCPGRRAEPGLHGLHLARLADARRGSAWSSAPWTSSRASRPRGARSRRSPG